MSTFHIGKKLSAYLMVFCSALPEPEDMLYPLSVDAQDNHVCFARAMDRVDKYGKDV